MRTNAQECEGSRIRGRTRLRSAVVAVSLALGLSLAGAGQASAADINNARNAGFESGLSDWNCSAGSGATVSSPVHGGTAALRATPAGQDNARCTQTVAVRPGSTYTLGAWVRGGYAYLGVTGTGTTDVSTWTPDSTAWKQLSTTFTTGASTTSVTVYTHGWYGQAAYLVDDVSVYGPDGGGGGDQPPTVPSAPAGLTVSGSTSSSVSLAWNPVPGATGYNVHRGGTKVQSVTGTSATVTGLAASTSYTFQVTATNAAGESARSATVTGTTTATPGGGTGVPKHAVTGYWQNFDNGAAVQKLSDVQSGYDIIAVAFADATATPGAVTFTLDSAGLGGYTVDQFKADVRAKQAAGKKVVVSVGGERGTVAVNSAASATNFADSVYALMRTYGFDGVDIDLENGLDATYMTQALRSLSAKAGPSLVITMAPQTIDMQSTSNAYFRTALNIKDILTVVNMQYYNSGSMLGCDGKVYSQGSVDFLTALACIQLENGLAPSQVGLGLPASTRGAGSGYVSPTVVNNALDCLTRGTNCGSFKPPRTYPDLRGAMTWSTNWDATAGNTWSNAVGPHVHGLP
ncbi:MULTISPECIES: chitinase [Streptomyces]|uniref:chitinase n=1 Tax=Streptomyces caniscabiei TaxID=2746961 RepID=A0ABU4MM04_9ACTN|nr:MULTISPECIES: glycoside hydrolase family 18 protein [Streptomyces]MDX2947843.1 glycoside hydrolase family 18 protein [Streptomyces caniscabiei]MDX2957136.1 glycoside hydrolase family 18 protein [Streptomyces caniscabiei]MDX2989393.1 glycoside hydrolase family 18 protein [Streptomyces caniscabiei]MDX3014536.1 glycoside hydrolase family 18 protein [Streptomyces caniscabiei]MDX3037602.1 glycoside hydrolase family 18 protein [Streptomyces caniscabiei]